EDERRRVARELHDDVLQRLAFVSIELGKLAGEIPESLAGRGLMVVVPCTKLVLVPVIVKVPEVPTGKTDGLIWVSTGILAGNSRLKAARMMKIAICPRVTGSFGQ